MSLLRQTSPQACRQTVTRPFVLIVAAWLLFATAMVLFLMIVIPLPGFDGPGREADRLSIFWRVAVGAVLANILLGTRLLHTESEAERVSVLRGAIGRCSVLALPIVYLFLTSFRPA